MNNINRRNLIAVSTVIPLFNEENNVTILYEKLKSVLEKLAKNYEIILVDDGSTDRTYQLICDIQKNDSHIRIIKLRRNFGQTSALSAGIDLASGDTIITMDGDLQHDPEEIPLFLKEIEKGFDVVCSWRKNRKDSYFLRVLPSTIANIMLRLISEVKIHDFGGTYRAYRREIIKKVELFGDAHRLIPALSADLGASVSEIPIKSIPRKYGRSNYGINRTFRVIFDLIFLKFLLGYIRRPFHFFGFLSILSFGLGFLISATLMSLFFLHFIRNLREHIVLLILSVFLMLTGIQFLVLGILAELITRTYFSSRNQKIYEIAHII